MISLKDIAVLYSKELRCALRERNIVINSILIPIFLYPTMLWVIYTGISFVGGQTAGFVSRVSVQIPPEHKALLDELKKDEQIEIVQASRSELAAGKLDVLLEFKEAANSKEQNYTIKLSYDKTEERSQTAFERVSAIVNKYRDKLILERSKQLGLNEKTLRGFNIDEENTATKLQMGQFILGLILPLFLIVMMASGAFYPALEATAGEREKSTWETLFVTATDRSNVVIAKYLYVATLSFSAGMLNLGAMLVSMKSVLAPLFGSSALDLSFRLPMGAYPVIALCSVLLSLFIAAGMMLLASFARTFKEGQSLVTPFYIGVFMPVMFLQVPGIKFTIYLALIPIVNVAMVFREAISGTFNWPMIAVTIVVEVLCIAGTLRLASVVMQYEDFLIGSYDGSLLKFIKERIWASLWK